MRPFQILVFITAGLAVFLWPLPAQAVDEPFSYWKSPLVMLCAQNAMVDHNIRTRELEALVNRGIVYGGFAWMGLYRNKDGSGWSIIITHANGNQCLILHGYDLEDMPWILGGETEDDPA